MLQLISGGNNWWSHQFSVKHRWFWTIISPSAIHVVLRDCISPLSNLEQQLAKDTSAYTAKVVSRRALPNSRTCNAAADWIAAFQLGSVQPLLCSSESATRAHGPAQNEKQRNLFNRQHIWRVIPRIELLPISKRKISVQKLLVLSSNCTAYWTVGRTNWYALVTGLASVKLAVVVPPVVAAPPVYYRQFHQ